MKISCVICTELIQIKDDIHATSCGHVFHYICLSDWLQRSQSCPQCRMEKNFSSSQIYPTVSDDTTDVEALQSSLDEALRKVIELRGANEEKETSLRTATEDLRKNEDTLKQYASELDSLNSIAEILKEQVDSVQIVKLKLEVEKSQAKEETICLRQNIEILQHESQRLRDENHLLRILALRLEDQMNALREEIKTLKLKTQNLQTKNDLLKKQTDCSETEVKSLKEENELSTMLTNRLEAEVQSLEEKMQRMKPELQSLLEVNELLKAEILRLQYGMKGLVEGSIPLEVLEPEEDTQSITENSQYSTEKQSSEEETKNIEMEGVSSNKGSEENMQNLTDETQCHQTNLIVQDETQCLKVEKKSLTENEPEEEPQQSQEVQMVEEEYLTDEQQQPEEVHSVKQLSSEQIQDMFDDANLKILVRDLKLFQLSEEEVQCSKDIERLKRELKSLTDEMLVLEKVTKLSEEKSQLPVGEEEIKSLNNEMRKLQLIAETQL